MNDLSVTQVAKHRAPTHSLDSEKLEDPELDTVLQALSGGLLPPPGSQRALEVRADLVVVYRAAVHRPG